MLPAKSVLFISDIHLSEHHPDSLHACLSFLTGPALFAEQLFILGDLFDVWLGKDISSSIFQDFKKACLDLKHHGVNLFFMPGNRDFLLEKEVLNDLGISLLRDPYFMMLHGVPTLLTHGDRLCTQDVTYQRYRKIARHPITRYLFLRLPHRYRNHIAKKLRNKSKNYQQQQMSHILDVTSEAVEKLIQKHQVKQLIHGHVHRPKVHEIPHLQAKRWVLGDWGAEGSYILATPGSVQLERYCPKVRHPEHREVSHKVNA